MIDYTTRRGEDSVTHVEEELFPPLTIVDPKRETASVEQTYKNFVALKVINHCVRLAVMRGGNFAGISSRTRVKQSGWGREMGHEVLELYTRTKAVVLGL